MSSVLVLFAHPALEKSRVNRQLIRNIRTADGVTFHDLYERYPDFHIDVVTEQKLLTEHDIIVLQHPFYWYSAPALVKEWLDIVFEHGWAYGHEGKALHGKILLNAITTGGQEEAYCRDGYNRFTMAQFLAPFDQTAHLCGMHYLPPFVVHGTYSLTPSDIDRHADDYRRVIEGLRDGTLDLDAARAQPRLNLDLDKTLPGRR